MSVYSGFATRNQQKHYDQVIYNLISTLMVRIVKFYKDQNIDEKAFRKIVSSQSKILIKLQKHKYLDPKYAELVDHFLKVLQKNTERQDNHLQFQLRRQSIEHDDQEGLKFNRTMSVLQKQIHQLKHYTQKIDTIQFEDLNSEKDLQRIPERRLPQKSKKKGKKSRNASIKSNIDIWDVRRQKLPEIPNLQPIQQTIMNRTRFNSKYISQQRSILKNVQQNNGLTENLKKLIQQKNTDKASQIQIKDVFQRKLRGKYKGSNLKSNV